MVGDILQPTHLLFVLVIALLVLGPKRLPEVAKTLGKGIRDFRGAISGDGDHPDHLRSYLSDESSSEAPAPVSETPTPAPTSAPAPTATPGAVAVPPPAAPAQPASPDEGEPQTHPAASSAEQHN